MMALLHVLEGFDRKSSRRIVTWLASRQGLEITPVRKRGPRQVKTYEPGPQPVKAVPTKSKKQAWKEVEALLRNI